MCVLPGKQTIFNEQTNKVMADYGGVKKADIAYSLITYYCLHVVLCIERSHQ